MKTPVISILLLAFLILAASCAAAGQTRSHPTLLSLYTRSDAVMIGRYDKREEFGTNRVGDGFTVVSMRTRFDIATVLKGEPQKFVAVEDEEFRYQIQRGQDAPGTAIFVNGTDSREEASQPRPGDTVLLFLNQAGDSFELVDDVDGVRKIDATSQSVYLDRIKELGSIFEKGDADPSKLAAWLVRCAEQPATRWDGTHELLQGFRRIPSNREKDSNGYERVDPSVSKSYGAEAAKALGTELRSALTQILMNSDFRANSDISEGDRELIALVKRWDATAAASYLLGQLKSRAFSSHENAGMMYKVAELIGDAQAMKLSRSYREMNSKDENVLTPPPNDPRPATLNTFIRLAETGLAKAQAGSTN